MKQLWKAGLVLLAGSALLVACSSRMAKTPPAASSRAPGYHPGKFVWHDLVTRDPASARRFYGALLGWEFQDTTRNGRPYAVARMGSDPVAGIVVHPDPGDEPALWLSYLSVGNVDQAVEMVTAAGGETLYPPTDLPGVARLAVVADPQGAALGLVRLNDGDPPDGPGPEVGHVFWMEYIADDADAAVRFYEGLSGYESTIQESRAGIEYHVLRRDGRSRAGLFQVPKVSDENVDPNWLPYVRVEDPAALASQVGSLGGQVILAPNASIRGGTLAIVADPTGGALALQKWPL
ncbi:MAG: VOC family protein [Acidobacteriota bacterium]|jgi:predicted enzyme related to lactoylglutathione lyase